jgi:hypothetical protein
MTDGPHEHQATVIPHPAGHQGVLTTAKGHELPVHTYDRGGEEVVLVVLTDVESPADGVDPATLEYTTVRGIVRLRGEAEFQPRSLVRFLVDGDAEVIQRRAFVRVHTPQQVTIIPDAPGNGLSVYTVDLSGGGMLLSRAPGLRVGDAVAFEISLGDQSPPIEGVARVVRVPDDTRRALAFERIDEGDRERLISFVFARMRDTRAKTRGDLL